MVDDILDAILRWFIDLLRETSMALLEQIIAAGFLVIPPWVTNAAEVINGRFRLLVILTYALVVCIGALMVMGSDNLQFTYSAREIIPRLIAGFFLALMSWEIVTTLANLNNAVVLAFVFGSSSESVPEDGTELGELVQEMLVPWNLSQMLIVELATGFLQIIAILLLFVSMIGRNIAWFLVALLSPVALAAHGLPMTEGAAFLWWRMTFACLGSSLGQAIILWTWQNLFQGLTDTDVAINYTLKPFYSLILVWLIWRVHKMAFLWARGRPARVPGARLLKTMASALVVGTILKSNPLGKFGKLGKIAQRSPLLNRIPGLKRFLAPKPANASKSQAARVRRPSPSSRTRNPKLSRQRANGEGPNGTNRPRQNSRPQRTPSQQTPESGNRAQSQGGKQSGRQGKSQGRKNGQSRNAKGNAPSPAQRQTPKPDPASRVKQPPPARQGGTAQPRANADRSVPLKKAVPPERRPQWQAPPERGEHAKRPPAWQPPPIRRPGYRKDESQ